MLNNYLFNAYNLAADFVRMSIVEKEEEGCFHPKA